VSRYAGGNLLDDLPREFGEERFDALLAGAAFRVERIVSRGHATPAGEWYDQDRDEWVLLLSGEALLRFEDEAEPRRLRPGGFVDIPAHCRHRVDWTHPETETVWLAIHYHAGDAGSSTGGLQRDVSSR
jgi:cupin 2 domain-containing protein